MIQNFLRTANKKVSWFLLGIHVFVPFASQGGVAITVVPMQALIRGDISITIREGRHSLGEQENFPPGIFQYYEKAAQQSLLLLLLSFPAEKTTRGSSSLFTVEQAKFRLLLLTLETQQSLLLVVVVAQEAAVSKLCAAEATTEEEQEPANFQTTFSHLYTLHCSSISFRNEGWQPAKNEEKVYSDQSVTKLARAKFTY